MKLAHTLFVSLLIATSCLAQQRAPVWSNRSNVQAIWDAINAEDEQAIKQLVQDSNGAVNFLKYAIQHQKPRSVTCLMRTRAQHVGFSLDEREIAELFMEPKCNLEIAKALVAGCPQIKSDAELGSAALSGAAIAENLDTLAYLLSIGLNVNTSSRHGGNTPLWNAAAVSKEKSVAFLLQHGADPKLAYHQHVDATRQVVRITVTELAANSRHLGVLKLLDKQGQYAAMIQAFEKEFTPDPNSPYIGSWKGGDEMASFAFELRKDGTGSYGMMLGVIPLAWTANPEGLEIFLIDPETGRMLRDKTLVFLTTDDTNQIKMKKNGEIVRKITPKNPPRPLPVKIAKKAGPVVEGKTIGEWIEFAKDDKCAQYSEACSVLRRLGPEQKECVPYLAGALTNATWGVRGLSIQALCKMGSDSPAIIPALVAALSDNPNISDEAYRLLLKMDRATVISAMSDRLKTSSGLDKVLCAQSFWRMAKHEEAALALIESAKDKDPKVRLNVMFGLNSLGPRVAPVLLDAAKDKDPQVRRQAILNLAYLRPKVDGALSIIVEALNDENESVRDIAAVALKQFDRDAAEKAGLVKPRKKNQ